jgi:SAM-dependent methyltransferase
MGGDAGAAGRGRMAGLRHPPKVATGDSRPSGVLHKTGGSILTTYLVPGSSGAGAAPGSHGATEAPGARGAGAAGNSPAGNSPAGNSPSEHVRSPAGDIRSPAEVVQAVRGMYARHPFPPAQRKYSYGRHAAYVRRFLDERGIDPRGLKFGDIACGTGLMMLDYAREFPETSFAGYDISEASVELANETLSQEAVPNARAHVRDITTLDLQDEFDYIVSWGTVHHLPDPAQGIAVLCRALRPGGILRVGVYGYYGNWERRLQQESIHAITEADGDDRADRDDRADGDDGDDRADGDDDAARIEVVRIWARGDRNFKNYYTAPPVDLEDDSWVVDEFLHVWEQHLLLRDVVSWLGKQGMRVLRLTDYYDREIPLDVASHSTNPALAAMVEKLPFESQCHVIEMIVRPYWLSLFAEKTDA